MKKQFTITEHNDWEGETFGYILDLTEEEKKYITTKLRNELGDDWFSDDDNVDDVTVSIQETNYTQDHVNTINANSDNGYMRRLGFYKIAVDIHDDEIKLYYDVFYKAVGLKHKS